MTGSNKVATTMTHEQVDRACMIYREQLGGHASAFPFNATRAVLNAPGYGQDLLDLHRRWVTAMCDIMVVEVDYDDPVWRKIDFGGRYSSVSHVTLNDYPETFTGKKRVRFRELAFDHDVMDEAVLTRMEREGCRQPFRSEVETYLEERCRRGDLVSIPRVGLIGPAMAEGMDSRRAHVVVYGDGMRLGKHLVSLIWHNPIRFVVVVP